MTDPKPRQPQKPGAPGPKQPEHPAERGAPPGGPQRAGKHFEIRKGKSGSTEAKPEEDEPIMNVALPRSITQEQEQADLKARLGREELIDIDKKNSLVKVKDSVAEPVAARGRSSGIWLLVVVVVLAGGFIAAAKLHLLDKFKQQQPDAPK
jgi:hypothetical protein